MCRKDREKVVRITVTSAAFDPSLTATHVRLRYSLFTAADEKIALSVVRVNTKPQYLVFDVHFLHLASKHKDLRVESSQRSCAERG
jgi:hypothetical protein